MKQVIIKQNTSTEIKIPGFSSDGIKHVFKLSNFFRNLRQWPNKTNQLEGDSNYQINLTDICNDFFATHNFIYLYLYIIIMF